MRKRLICRFGTICLLIVLFDSAVQPLRGEEIQSRRKEGSVSRYVDVNSQGHILEIDYAGQKARVVGTIEIPNSSPPIVWQAWFFDNADLGIFLLLEPSHVRGWFGRLYIYSKASLQLQSTSVRIDLTGDFGFLPVSEKLFFVEYLDTLSKKTVRLVFDASENKIAGSFDFPVSYHTIYAMSATGANLFVSNRLEPVLYKFDIESRKSILVQNAATLLGHEDPNGWAFVGALGRRYALIGKKHQITDSVEWFQIDLENMQEVAKSAPMPFFSGEFFVETDGEGKDSISCIEQHIVDAHYQATGKIYQFVRRGDRIEPAGEIVFSPKTEVALRIDKGRYEILPRYDFDYISLLTLRKKVFLELPGHYSPDLVPWASEVFNKSAKQFRIDIAKKKADSTLRRLLIE